jgi:hypothetical protein
MTDPETAAEAQLREIADALEALRFRLLGVQASLPPSCLERDPLQEQDEMDTATEIRAVVGCVLEDGSSPRSRSCGISIRTGR